MKKHYLLIMVDDIEPNLIGPFNNTEDRDQKALYERDMDPNKYNGLYTLDIENNIPVVDTYSGIFFEGGNTGEEPEAWAGGIADNH